MMMIDGETNNKISTRVQDLYSKKMNAKKERKEEGGDKERKGGVKAY